MKPRYEGILLALLMLLGVGSLLAVIVKFLFFF